MHNASTLMGQRGMGLLGIFLIILLIIFLIFFGDLAFIFASSECIDENIFSCLIGALDGDDDVVPEEGSVTATGVLSGEFKGEEHTVTVTMVIPLEGGAVTGTFSGDCDGNLKGTYVASTNIISGKGSGSCAFVIPASGEFSGSVNTSAKSVTVQGTGRAAGIEKSGSLTLSYSTKSSE